MCALRGNLDVKEAGYGSVFSSRLPKLFIIGGMCVCNTVLQQSIYVYAEVK